MGTSPPIPTIELQRAVKSYTEKLSQASAAADVSPEQRLQFVQSCERQLAWVERLLRDAG